MLLLSGRIIRQPWTLRRPDLLIRRTFKSTSKTKQTVEPPNKITNDGPGKPEEKDIVIYRQEPTKYYQILNLFCISQLMMWSFVSSACHSMRDIPIDPKVLEDKDAPFWKKINFGEAKYKWTGIILSAGLGYTILGAGWFYILRSVQFIVLRKGQKSVSIATYSPFKKTRIVDYNLDRVSAVGSRNSVNSVMPIQIQGNRFHYIIDVAKGHFPHPKLFDQTVGLHRKLNK